MKFSKLYVDLNNIEYNLEKIKEKQNKDCMILAMVKANSYGLGMIEVSKFLEERNLVNYLGVAYLDEAICLKESGLKLPVIILGEGLIQEIPDLINYSDIIPSVSDYNYAKALNEACKKEGKKQTIHIEINTGMYRVGINYKEAVETVQKIAQLENLDVQGIYTHFSSADSDMDFTNAQKERFDNVLNALELSGINIPIIHACNSAGSMVVKSDKYNLIRPGIMMYGYYPDESLRDLVELRPACTLKSTICHIAMADDHTPIGYNQRYVTNKTTKIATVNIGYADGLKRLLSNKGQMLIQGKKCTVIGSICMDACMVDVTNIPDISVGMDVIVFDDKNVTVDEIAKLCSTINYEILTSLGNRIERIYIK